MYKLLATDLDGTLLSNFEISEENKKALCMAENAGIHVVICSGRSFMSIDYFAKILGIKNANNYGICYNGAMVYKTENFHPIYEMRLNLNTAHDIIRLLKDKAKGVDLMCYMGDKLILENITSGIELYLKASKISANIMSFDKMDENVSKILVLGEKKDLTQAKKLLTDFYEETEFYFSSDNLLEIVQKEVSKGNALKFLGEYLGIEREEIIAIGDNQNDISMIEYAGLGLAVANASNEVKAAADCVIKCTCDEHALKEVFDRFIGGSAA